VIHHGDLFDVLPTLAERASTRAVTDPPYGIGFMGKQWDSFSPLTAQRKAGMRQCGQLPRAKQSNPNLKGRTVNGAISTSQIEYDMGLAGLRGFQDWTARWATEVHPRAEAWRLPRRLWSAAEPSPDDVRAGRCRVRRARLLRVAVRLRVPEE
jgi:hypothetical protein